MKHLLFTDTHVDDNPDNEYRWGVFDRVHEILTALEDEISMVFLLGDAWDRKDRFSGIFVNRLIEQMRAIGRRKPFWIDKGNHDDPLHGPAFFQFINGMVEGVRYITEPTPCGNIIVLPFTPDPMRDWAGINFKEYRAAFLHCTVTGAISESGHELTGRDINALPRDLRLYSGDVHNPQTIRNLTYVGCPHPIHFGDKFQPRMLLLDADTLEIDREIEINTIRKVVIAINSMDDLADIGKRVRRGDQVIVRCSLSAADVDRVGEIERAIASWAQSTGATLASTEMSIETGVLGAVEDADMDPDGMLDLFCDEEGLSDAQRALGHELLMEARG